MRGSHAGDKAVAHLAEDAIRLAEHAVPSVMTEWRLHEPRQRIGCREHAAVTVQRLGGTVGVCEAPGRERTRGPQHTVRVPLCWLDAPRAAGGRHW